MTIESTPDRYGSVAVTIHWTSTAAILAALATGLLAGGTIDPAGKGTLVLTHAALGSVVLVLTLLRILWWGFADRRPAPAAGQPHWQDLSARVVHVALYVAIFALAASGIATLVLSGAATALISGQPLPDLAGSLPRLTHGLVSKMMIALLSLHVGAALYHHFIRHDRLLGRMGLGPA